MHKVHEGEWLKSYLSAKKVVLAELARSWEIDRTVFYAYFKSKTLHEATIERFRKEYGLEFINAYRKAIANQPTPLVSSDFNILHIPQPAEAGFLGGSFNPVYEDELIPWKLPYFRIDGYSWRVSGRSMEATLEDGYLVITSQKPLEKYNQIENDFIYVIVTDSEILIKRINKHIDGKSLWLISDNEDFEMIEMPFDEVRAIYKARRYIGYNLSQKLRYE